jgi:REP element-mobilizing transposase RayT
MMPNVLMTNHVPLLVSRQAEDSVAQLIKYLDQHTFNTSTAAAPCGKDATAPAYYKTRTIY